MTPASSVFRIFATVRRAFLLLAILGALAAPVAYAQEGTTTDTTTTGDTTTGATTTEEEPPPPPPPVVPENVTVAGVLIGGLTPEDAKAALRAFFTRPVVFAFRGHRREAAPWHVGARVDLGGAVAAALAAEPGDALTLPVRFDRAYLRAFVDRLARRWSSRPVDSTVRLRSSLRPYITKARDGYKIRPRATRLTIRAALAAHERGPLAVSYSALRPDVTRRNFGPVIVIRRGSHGLYLYRGSEFRRYFPVAVGMSQYPTPLGRFSIATMQRNPWWYPPDASWAAGASPIPPGPSNPLGTRWMGLSVGGVGIHGTPNVASIGYSASHGCIRMRIPDAEWLFERVRIGTPVFIVSA